MHSVKESDGNVSIHKDDNENRSDFRFQLDRTYTNEINVKKKLANFDKADLGNEIKRKFKKDKSDDNQIVKIQNLNLHALKCNLSDQEFDDYSQHISNGDEQDYGDPKVKNQIKRKATLAVEQAESQSISYYQLKSTISQNHPADESGKQYSLYSSLGSFSLFQMQDAEGQDLVPISDVQKDIGLGPCLMLMTTKSIAYLFLILSVLNIPLYMCYHTHQPKQSGSALSNLFFQYSIGNVGNEEPHCSKKSFQSNEYQDLDFKCHEGKMISITMFGFPLQPDVDCEKVEDNKDDFAWQSFMKKSCNFNDGLFKSESAKDKFEQMFDEKCKDKSECNIAFRDYRQYISENCTKIEKLRRNNNEAVLLGGIRCMPNKIKMPFEMMEDLFIFKQDLASFIIFIDLLCVISVIAFLVIIKERQRQFIKAFKVQTIQMDDYAIRVDDLPHIDTYGGDRDVLKAHLWNHFYNLFEENIKQNQIIDPKDNEDENQNEGGDFTEITQRDYKPNDKIQIKKIDFTNKISSRSKNETKIIQTSASDLNKSGEVDELEERRKMLKEQFEIVDITFAEQNNFEIESLMKMYPIHKDIEDQIQYGKNKESKAYIDFLKFKQQKLADEKERYKNYLRNMSEEPQNQLPPKYAYIVFRRMTAMDAALKQYNLDFFEKFMVKTGRKFKFLKNRFGSQIDEDKTLQPKMMHGYCLINVQNGGLPDEVMWMNIKYSKNNRHIRWVIIWLIALLLILIAFTFMVFLKNQGIVLKRNIQQQSSDCPGIFLDSNNKYFAKKKVDKADKATLDVNLKRQSWELYTKESNSELLNCFCYKINQENGLQAVFNINFNDVANDPANLCSSWLFQQIQAQSMVIITGVIINVINVVICVIFEFMQTFERNHSQNTATRGKFYKFSIMLYINISLITLIVSLGIDDYEDYKFLGFIPLFQGEHQDFTASWFYDVGSTICTALTLNIFSPHGSKILIAFMYILLRWRDRYWKLSRKHPKIILKKQEEAQIRSLLQEDDDIKEEYFEGEGGQTIQKEQTNSLQSSGRVNVLLSKQLLYMVKQPQLSRNIKTDVITRQSTQHDLEELYTGIEMDSHFVYSQILTNFFSCMTFSAGIPLLYVIGFLFSCGLYWVYKILLLKFYSKTTSFNQELAVKAIDVLQFSVIIHILVGSFFYSNAAIFGRSTDIESNFFYEYIKNNYPGLESRFQSNHSIFYFGFSFLCLLTYVCVKIGFVLVAALYRFITQAKEEVDSEGVETDSDFYKDLTLQQLRLQYARFDKEYSSIKELFKYIDKEKDKEAKRKLEIYFKPELRERYLDWHIGRIEAIQEVVTSHISHFIQEVKKTKKDLQLEKKQQDKKKKTLNQIGDKQFQEKLSFIEGSINAVKKAKKGEIDGQIETLIKQIDEMDKKKIGYSNPKCFRLQDITQSFYIYDKATYIKAKMMREILEKEETQQLRKMTTMANLHKHINCEIDVNSLQSNFDDHENHIDASPCQSHGLENPVVDSRKVFKQSLIKLQAIKNYKLRNTQNNVNIQFSNTFKSRIILEIDKNKIKQAMSQRGQTPRTERSTNLKSPRKHKKTFEDMDKEGSEIIQAFNIVPMTERNLNQE